MEILRSNFLVKIIFYVTNYLYKDIISRTRICQRMTHLVSYSTAVSATDILFYL